jgi:hypothetical protein
MEPRLLHRLRQRSRRFAAATVALFALNWLGLALMPCAMAHAAPVSPAVSAAQAAPVAAPEHCAAHAAASDAAVDAGAKAHPSTSGERCPWCLDADGRSAAADCGATPKPALESRDAKNPVTPLLVALSATVLGLVPVEAASTAAWANAGPALPPEDSVADRYCRRLE